MDRLVTGIHTNHSIPGVGQAMPDELNQSFPFSRFRFGVTNLQCERNVGQAMPDELNQSFPFSRFRFGVTNLQCERNVGQAMPDELNQSCEVSVASKHYGRRACAVPLVLQQHCYSDVSSAGGRIYCLGYAIPR